MSQVSRWSPGPDDAVGVVVPHHGDPALAAAVVGALARQRGAPPLEVVVVDDASPTPYPDAGPAAAGMRVDVVRRATNGGFGAAVNTGAQRLATPWLLVLNSDLVLEPDTVARLLAAAAPAQPSMVAPRLVGPGGREGWSARRRHRLRHHAVEWAAPGARFAHTDAWHRAVGHDLRVRRGRPFLADWLVGAALLLPLDAFRDVGGFDERFHMNAEDADLARRLQARGVPSMCVPTIEVHHLGGASSGDDARRRRRLVQARLRYAEKWHGPAAREALRATLATVTVLNLGWNAVRRVRDPAVRPLAETRRDLLALAP